MDIVKILNLEETDENILKYAKIIKDKSLVEKEVDMRIANGTLLNDFYKGLE